MAGNEMVKKLITVVIEADLASDRNRYQDGSSFEDHLDELAKPTYAEGLYVEFSSGDAVWGNLKTVKVSDDWGNISEVNT